MIYTHYQCMHICGNDTQLVTRGCGGYDLQKVWKVECTFELKNIQTVKK